jgi:hypothetical protein
MKKNLLWMFAAILFCGVMTTSCGSDDDDNSNPSGDTNIVGMRIAYAVVFHEGYNTLEDYTISVTWTNENGKDVTENITTDFAKDVMLKATQGTNGTFIVKCTPTNSNKEEHDIGVDFAITAKPMNSKGEVTDRGSITEASNYIKKGLSGDSYKEYTFTKKFQLVDSQIKNIGE